MRRGYIGVGLAVLLAAAAPAPEYSAQSLPERLSGVPQSFPERLGGVPQSLPERLGGVPRSLPERLGGVPQSPSAAAPSPAAVSRQLLDRYCVTCHNERLKTGGLLLDQV